MMLDGTRARRFAAAMLTALLVLVACYDGPTGPEPLTGTWIATTMRITPDGGETADLLAEGASLTITFGGGYTTTGTLSLPGESPASMNGTYIRRRNTLEFVQTADTFVRDLSWDIGTNTLTASDQTLDDTEFEIVLTREIEAVVDRRR